MAETQTLGFPVVPEEKERNASFLVFSPGERTFSTKAAGLLSPSSINSSTVGIGIAASGASPGIGLSNATLSADIPAFLAAESAVAMQFGWVIIIDALMASN